MIVEHGGTDAGRPVRVDASTNANPLGPSPMARAAVAACDLGPYPDPSYSQTRAVLAEHVGTDTNRVVVGPGATELIHRLVRVLGGPVVVEASTFSEYEAAAAAAGVEVRRVADPDAWEGALSGAAVAFVCSPGNPDGRVRSAAWADRIGQVAARTGTTLVWDLAYAPLVTVAVPVSRAAVRLHAPNKAHGCTGLRAGWLEAPVDLAARLRAAAVSWNLSTPGAAFLEAAATEAADAWVRGCVATLRQWRDELAHEFAGLGLVVEPGDAPFVLVEVPDASATAARLRERCDVKVRDATSLGRPGWWRVAAQPPGRQGILVAAVSEVLGVRT